MSGATQCEKFVRNAWKKELCSNCFKAKEEHPEKPTSVLKVHPKLPDPPKEGILKGSKNKACSSKKTNKVIFPTTEFEVIGYGGDDVFSDDDELPDVSDGPVREEPDTEQDRALQRLTKSNTDFNSVPGNLLGTEVNEPVRLGKPLVDDKGKKKTLLVSVTPFGGTAVNGSAKQGVQAKFGSTQSESPVTVTEKSTSQENARVELAESARIEDGEAQVSERSAVTITQPKVIEVGIKRSQPIDKNSKFRPNKECNEETKNANQIIDETNRVSSENKLNDKLTTSNKVANLLDKAKKRVHNLPVIGDPNHFKFKTIDFSPVSQKRSPLENNKPVVLDMYDLRGDIGISEKTGTQDNEPKLLSSHISITPTIVFETKKSEHDLFLDSKGGVEVLPPVSNVSSLHRSPKSVAAALRAELLPCEQPAEPSVGTAEVVASIETDLPKDCSNETNNAQIEDVVLCDKLPNYEGIIGGEEVTVFSLESSQVEEVGVPTKATSGPQHEEPRPAPEGRADSGVADRSLEGHADSSAADRSEDAPVEQMEMSELGEHPPALPASPPPAMDPRVSFLHQLTAGSKLKLGEKPKVPVKPVVIPNKKPPFRVFSPRPKSPSIETFLDAPTSPPASPHMPLAETLSDSAKKRPAPQPPSPRDEGPPLRAARSSDNLLELSRRCQVPQEASMDTPAPVPRRSLSLSQDCLLNSGVNEMQGKKKSSRGRFSLRKLLHLGKQKEGGKEGSRREYRIEGLPASPAPSPRIKPKPEIIHPLDLTGARVEVVPPPHTPHRKSRRSSSSASSSSGEHRESDIPSDSSASQSVSSSGNSGTDAHISLERSRKPPPPPRGLSLDQTDKPARPPPPKSAMSPKRDVRELLPQSSPEVTSLSKPRDNFYVNIGEVRSGLAPNKPVRTGSLREVDLAKKLVPLTGSEDAESKRQYWTGSLRGAPKCPPLAPPEDSGYESFDVSLSNTDSHTSSQTSSLTAEENLYECVQGPGHLGSSPDSSAVLRGVRQTNIRPDRRSEGSVPDGGPEYIKFRFLRSVSMPYCASEAESDIYSPYSFCGSEMGEDDYEWSPTSGRFQKVSRLKMKKGRSIVHKNLEDNYGAVIVANHEALTQVVEQMHQGPVVPPILRPLSSAHNLRWSDFVVVKDNAGVYVERRAFYPALWGLNPVTLCVAPEQSVSSLHGKPPFSLHPLTELHDLVPASFLPDSDAQDHTLVQCSISVLSRIQVETLANYCRSVSNIQLTEEIKKEIHFILLQTINALKTLQAAGIEEAPHGLLNVVVCREERDPHPRVCILPGPVREPAYASLCACLLELLEGLPATELSHLLSKTLRAEKAVSLSQAKALLEFTLWGPADIAFGGARGAALQRWLDLERASVLHGLVRTRADLSVFEECHLLFLVYTNAKVLTDASVLLETLAVNS